MCNLAHQKSNFQGIAMFQNSLPQCNEPENDSCDKQNESCKALSESQRLPRVVRTDLLLCLVLLQDLLRTAPLLHLIQLVPEEQEQNYFSPGAKVKNVLVRFFATFLCRKGSKFNIKFYVK